MESLLHYYPIILYLLGSVLLIVLIILLIKLIKVVNKMNVILEDAYDKTKSLNGIFHTIDKITDMVSSMSDSIVTNITGIIGKLFHNKFKKESGEEDE